MTAKDDGPRVISVNAEAFHLFQRIGLKPPASGQFDPVDLDRQLDGQDISTRMKAKGHLRDCGLLPAGTRLDSVSASADTSAVFEKLPSRLQHVMRKGGLEQELDANGGTISIERLDAAAQNMSIEDRVLVKHSLAKFGLLRAA